MTIFPAHFQSIVFHLKLRDLIWQHLQTENQLYKKQREIKLNFYQGTFNTFLSNHNYRWKTYYITSKLFLLSENCLKKSTVAWLDLILFRILQKCIYRDSDWLFSTEYVKMNQPAEWIPNMHFYGFVNYEICFNVEKYTFQRAIDYFF